MGWPKLFSPPSGLTGRSPSRSNVPGHHVLPTQPALGEPEVLHQHQLGGREAVVHLGHRQLRTRVGDAGLAVGVLGRARPPRGSSCSRSRGRSARPPGPATKRQRLHVQRVVAVPVGVLGPADDRRGRPVADAASSRTRRARPATRGDARDRLERHLLAELRPRVHARRCGGSSTRCGSSRPSSRSVDTPYLWA